MNQPTIEQIRARQAMLAHARAREVLQENGGSQDREATKAGRYRSTLRSLPALLKGSGLIHAAALLGADSNGGAQQVLSALTEWLEHADCPIVWTHRPTGSAKDRLLRTALDEPEMRALWRAEEEALVFAGWLKLLVESDQSMQATDQAENRP